MAKQQKAQGYQGIEMELEVSPGKKKKYIVGKLSPEEIEIVESDRHAEKDVRDLKIVIGGPLDIKFS